MLQSTLNTSSLALLKYLKDVRDVAEAILLAYERPEAEGRYLCTAYAIRARILVEKLKSMFPSYNYPKRSSVQVDQWMLDCYWFGAGLLLVLDCWKKDVVVKFLCCTLYVNWAGKKGSWLIFLQDARITELEARKKAEFEEMEAQQKPSDEVIETQVVYEANVALVGIL
ncbi:hypothetical protein LguiA_026281 [Lonicera macranthoides]